MASDYNPAHKVAYILNSHLEQSLADSEALVSNLDEMVNILKGGQELPKINKIFILAKAQVMINSETMKKNAHFKINSSQQIGWKVCSCKATGIFRGNAMKIISAKWFERFIIIIILTNCVIMAIEPAVECQSKYQNKLFDSVELFFQEIYTAEMLLKILALGFISGTHSYIKDPWNLIDFLIVMSSWATILSGASNIAAIRAVRALKTVRTLSAFPRMAKLVQNLVSTLPSMANIGFICAISVLVFACITMQLFSGTLKHRCVEMTSITNSTNYTGEVYQMDSGDRQHICQIPQYIEETYMKLPLMRHNKDPCDPGYACLKRVNPGDGQVHFDNVLVSSLIIFEMFTLDGWVDVMHQIRYSQNSTMYDPLFVGIVYIGAFFVVNLVTAVQFNYYTMIKEQQVVQDLNNMKLQAVKLKQDNRRKRLMKRLGSDITTQIYKKDCWKQSCPGQVQKAQQGIRNIVSLDCFETFIQIIILVNSIMLGAEWYGMPDYWKNTQAYANSVFLIIFTFEAAFKIIGLGFFEYVKDGFNLFDFLIVISGFVEVIFQSGAGAALSVLRGFRILRIFKLLKKAKGLQTLVQTILRAAVDASNLGLLIILFVCINALIGKQLYSGEVIDEEGNHSRTGFEDFQTAVLTVFICMTGTWVGPMQDITRNNSSIGVIFFLEIVLFGNFLLLNLFLAILLQNIEHVMGTQREEEKEMKRSLQEKSSDSLRAQGQIDFPMKDRTDDVNQNSSFFSQISQEINEADEFELNKIELEFKRVNSEYQEKRKSEDLEEDSFTTSRSSSSYESSSYYSQTSSIAEERKSSPTMSLARFSNCFTEPQTNKPVYSSNLNKRRLYKEEDISTSSKSKSDKVINCRQSQPPVKMRLSQIVKPDREKQPLSSISSMGKTDSQWNASNSSQEEQFTQRTAIRLQNVQETPKPASFRKLLSESTQKLPRSANGSRQDSELSTPKNYYEHKKFLLQRNQSLPFTIDGSSEDDQQVPIPYFTYKPTKPMSEQNPYEVRIGLERHYINIISFVLKSEKQKQMGHNILQRIYKEEQKSKSTKCEHSDMLSSMLRQNYENQSTNIIMEPNYRHKNAQKMICDEGNSLEVFSNKGYFRQWAFNLVTHAYFEQFTLIMILLYSGLLAIESNKTITDLYTQTTCDTLNIILSALFCFECLLRIIAIGCICNKNSFLRDNFNVFDFVIVLFVILSFIAETLWLSRKTESKTIVMVSNIRYVTSLAKVFRALRPLRLVRAREMRDTVESLIDAIPSVAQAMMLNLVVLYVFSILGVQLFCGRFSYCEGAQLLHNKTECLAQNKTWETYPQNFDNLAQSWLTFYEIQTLEDWHVPVFNAVDSQSEQDLSPIVEHRPQLMYLFIAFIFLSTFFIHNLIITILITSYQWQTRKKYGMDDFNKHEITWLQLQQNLLAAKIQKLAQRPTSTWRGIIFDIQKSDCFDNFITICVGVNTLALCFDYDEASGMFKKSLEQMNVVFVVVFLIEAIIKIVGVGPSHYFRELKNQFDFFLVFVSIFGLFEGLIPINITAMRVIRGARILRVFKSLQEIQIILTTLMSSMKSFAFVLFLSFVVLFVFALLGMNFFGHITEGKYGAITPDVNFASLWNALMTLTQAETGENWHMLMRDTMYSEGFMYSFFWLSFVVVKTDILLQIIVAVIFEKLEQAAIDKNLSMEGYILNQSIDEFVKTWQTFDPDGTNFIPTVALPRFIMALPPPLGFHGQEIPLVGHASFIMLKLIRILNLKDRNGKIYFPEVLWSMFFNVCGVSTKKLNQCKMIKQVLKNVGARYPLLREQQNLSMDDLVGNLALDPTETQDAYGMLCFIKVQRRWRYNNANKKKVEEQKKKQKRSKLHDLNINQSSPAVKMKTFLNKGVYGYKAMRHGSFRTPELNEEDHCSHDQKCAKTLQKGCAHHDHEHDYDFGMSSPDPKKTKRA